MGDFEVKCSHNQISGSSEVYLALFSSENHSFCDDVGANFTVSPIFDVVTAAFDFAWKDKSELIEHSLSLMSSNDANRIFRKGRVEVLIGLE